MKRALKHAWSKALYHTRLLDGFRRVMDAAPGGPRCVILMFHRVLPRDGRGGLFSAADIQVFQDTFDRQMRLLAERHRVIPLAELLAALQGGGRVPARSAVITFDDGWEDNYHVAFPVLKKYGLPATVFLTAAYVGTRRVFWQESVLFLIDRLAAAPGLAKQCFERDGLAGCGPLVDGVTGGAAAGAARRALISRLKRVDDGVVAGLIGRLKTACGDVELPVREHSFLSWRQIAEMNGPLVSFGSHGLEHRLLDSCSEGVLEEEVRSSKELIERHLGVPVGAFAYPNGNYDERVVAAVRRAGYAAGVTVDEGLNAAGADPYRLKRVNICEARCADGNGRFSEEVFAARLAGLL